MVFSPELIPENTPLPPCLQTRPHTVHSTSSTSRPAVNFIAEEEEEEEEEETSEGEVTPRASAAGPSRQQPAHSYAETLRRRLSRDDTANDLHEVATTATLNTHDHDADDESKENHLPSVNAVSKEARYLSQPHGPLKFLSEGTSFHRRVSRKYHERVSEWRDNMQRSSRTRRLSTPHLSKGLRASGSGDAMSVDSFPRQPTSPSKRNARQDDRPRKNRQLTFSPITNRHITDNVNSNEGLPASGERKDTPAPLSQAGRLPMRPATSRCTPTIISAPGGDGARKAAAMHNHTTCASPGQVWDDDIHSRRGRLGSLSSAADSGADLSTYSGSEMSARDMDGDTNMFADELMEEDPPATCDFTKILPSEIALQVFEYLDAKDLLRAEQVSRGWNNMSKDTAVWRTVFLRRYQRQVMTDPPPTQVGGSGCGRVNKPNQEWRKMYKARLDLDENWRAGAQDAGKAVYLSGHTDSVYCLQFDEEKIITGSRDRTIRVWDINTFQCIKVIGAPQHKPQVGPKVLRTVDYPSFHMATASVNGTAYGDSIYHVPREWHDASILCLQYDEKILVTGSSDSDLLIWDIKTYEPIKRLKKHTGGVLDVALDAKHIVSCSKDSRIIVWDRQTLEAKGDLTGHRGPVNAVQLRGHLLVSASGDGIARLWDLNQMKLIKEFSAKERGLAAVEFSEDMKYVLAGGNDNITYKFETETGREVMQFTGHSQLVRSLWLDSANNRVVSGSYDLDLRVYDFVNGQELWRGEEWTTSWMLAAKSDYRRIVATSQDGRILIVDFGIYKGLPGHRTRDGMTVDNVDLLRQIENDNTIKFINPWDKTKGLHGV